MLLSLQFVHESRLFHNKCDNGDIGWKDLIPDSCFVLLGTRQWYPPHAFGAQGSANHFGSVRYFPPDAWSPNVKLKRVIPASWLGLFHVASAMVLTSARDSDLSRPEPVCSLSMWSLPPNDMNRFKLSRVSTGPSARLLSSAALGSWQGSGILTILGPPGQPHWDRK